MIWLSSNVLKQTTKYKEIFKKKLPEIGKALFWFNFSKKYNFLNASEKSMHKNKNTSFFVFKNLTQSYIECPAKNS